MKLYDFQEQDLKELINNKDKALIAYEMGLGKTYLSLNYLKYIFNTNGYYLIVTPLYLQMYWKDKIKEVLNRSCFINSDNVNSPGIYLLNYAKLKIKILKDHTYLRPWDLIIADEANYIKNPRTKRFRAFKKLHEKNLIKRILLLTGTPMQNNVTELWSLLYLSGIDNITYYQFIELFAKKIKAPWGYKIIGLKNKKLLIKALKTIMIRRLRKDVAPSLPPKVFEIIKIPMLPLQKQMYDKVKVMLKEEVLPLLKTSNGNLVINNILVKMLRLKQIADDASLIEPNIPLDQASNKIVFLEDYFKLNKKEGVFIFTQFKSFAQKIAKRYSLGLIDGDISVEERAKLVNQLNEHKIGVVATTQSVTYGLDTPGALVEIFLDRLYNPKRMEQAQDRSYRISRQRGLPIFEIHSENSIDTLIFKKGMNKVETIKEVLQE